ncbi:MAG: S46 family peptidase [Rhodothermales bacterium]|nr:S46 family peptidase [Rhodothermales bacterium]
MKPALVSLLAAGLVLVTGCSTSKHTAVVTEKPPSTEKLGTPQHVATPAPAKPADMVVDPGRFDGGKMWTFDNPPMEYFEEAYDFEPDSAWFEKARLGSLRFSTYCSASFVSPNGLIATNHHCGRSSVSDVSKEGEDLLDNGFYAGHVEDERKVKDLYVEQLISIDDVTDEVYEALDGVFGDEAQSRTRTEKAEAIAKRMTAAAKATDSTLTVEVIELYHGGQYSAYTFKRYEDVRLVMAPELQIGYFGGDPDNFTYPRYNLDFSLFRAYGEDGLPLKTENYFPWSVDGAREGDVVFVVGNPGSTSRLSTVSQLEFERDYSLPAQLGVFTSRSVILREFIEAHPEDAEKYDLRNTWFSLENSIKAVRGQLAGLRDPYLIARKRGADQDLRQTLSASDSLNKLFGSVFDDIATMQKSKQAVARQSGALTFFGSEGLTSHVLLRGLYGYLHDFLKERGAPADRTEPLKKDGLAVEDWPAEIEEKFIAARLTEMQTYLGSDHPIVKGILNGSSPDSVAARVVKGTALKDSTGFAGLLETGYLSSGDPTVKLVEALAPAFLSLGQQLSSFQSTEENLNARLARARFAVYGRTMPPDATFSLRLADGVVAGYDYNGTRAPAFTTFYGLLDHYYSYRGRKEWKLPERWLNLPPEFDLEAPVNFVSTNDITGGNSGSPVLNRNLELVGLAFDSNIEALPNEYLFMDVIGRTVSVDSRGILEVLDDVYDADRLVLELKSGALYETEAQADEATMSAN